MVAENQDSMSEHSDSSDASFSDSEKSSGSFAGLVDYWVGFGVNIDDLLFSRNLLQINDSKLLKKN